MIKAAIFDMYETLVTLFSTPIYFSEQMAEDTGIPEDAFKASWHTTEDDRTLGRVTVDEVVARILKENNRFSEETTNRIMEKRIACKREAFMHMHSEIIPMMEELKKHLNCRQQSSRHTGCYLHEHNDGIPDKIAQ